MNIDKLSQYSLSQDYLQHKVFEQLQEYVEFYDTLSHTMLDYPSLGTKTISNLDIFVFTSISGTLDSILDILKKGRINDAYALLRKYYDSTVINFYTNLYLEDNFSMDNLIVEQIDNWVNGKQSIPEYRVLSKYIKDSPKLQPITAILHNDTFYKEIRNRCNDHTHYNYYHNLLLNDNQIHFYNRLDTLDLFTLDLTAIFIQHFAYLFYLKEIYMMSTDHGDYLDINMTPPDDSQYWVANFIQEAFSNWVKPNRPDIANEMKRKIVMKLE